MKPEEILKAVQKMYKKYKFVLDDDKENICIDSSYIRERSGEIHSDEKWSDYVKRTEHFCTIEFAKRMFKLTKKL